MTQREERLRDLLELEHRDPLQRVLAAIHLFCTLPVRDLARCTPKQIDAIAAPVEIPRG